MSAPLELLSEPVLAVSIFVVHAVFGMALVYSAYAGFERNPAAGVTAAALLTITIIAGEWMVGRWFIELFTAATWPILRQSITTAAIGSSIGASMFALAFQPDHMQKPVNP
ncbi:hypothetical protein [Halogeometricum sp. CBA1124]|uniref:hypothetical protein n=1 Tax=Halogeometricum sp. CBA1124 TaxID=2668071 RepID=UPI0014298762|nr:hypothetical protein [Halogeometricum sp. CBA1124]MUV56088.1 hypothetical protein [Halogeometricum sp. CBA1124]